MRAFGGVSHGDSPVPAAQTGWPAQGYCHLAMALFLLYWERAIFTWFGACSDTGGPAGIEDEGPS